MRGEHYIDERYLELTLGSSPHARGTRARHVIVVGLLGIIPACAGNTCISKPLVLSNVDHPRMRGEHRDE